MIIFDRISNNIPCASIHNDDIRLCINDISAAMSKDVIYRHIECLFSAHIVLLPADFDLLV